MDAPIKEPNYLVISWKVLGIILTALSIAGGFIWRLFWKIETLESDLKSANAAVIVRVETVEKLAEDIHDHETGAASLGAHLNLLLERMATVETKIEERDKNFCEDIREIKNILNKYFKWDGHTERRGRDNVPTD